MSIEQHIEELRAELKACDDTAESALIRRELDAALAQKAAADNAFNEAVAGQG